MTEKNTNLEPAVKPADKPKTVQKPKQAAKPKPASKPLKKDSMKPTTYRIMPELEEPFQALAVHLQELSDLASKSLGMPSKKVSKSDVLNYAVKFTFDRLMEEYKDE